MNIEKVLDRFEMSDFLLLKEENGVLLAEINIIKLTPIGIKNGFGIMNYPELIRELIGSHAVVYDITYTMSTVQFKVKPKMIITKQDVRNKIIPFFRQEPIAISNDGKVMAIEIKLSDIEYFMRITNKSYTLSDDYKERVEQFADFGELLIPGVSRKNLRFLRFRGSDTVSLSCKLKYIFYKDVVVEGL